MARPKSTYVLAAAAACLVVLAAAVGPRSIAGSRSDKDDDRTTTRNVYVYHTGDDEESDRPYLGVQVEEETGLESGGARIERVLDDTPADEAGLEDDDVIVEVDGRTIRGPAGLREALGKKDPGDQVRLEIVRDGKHETITAELGQQPRHHTWSWGGEHRPLLGVELAGVTPELREHLGGSPDRGVLVGRIVDDSAAEKAGIRVGDLIVGVEGDSIEDPSDLHDALADHEGETVEIDLVREGKRTQVRADLPERRQRGDSWNRSGNGRSSGDGAYAYGYTTAARAVNAAQRAAMAQARGAYRQALAAQRQARSAIRGRDVTLY
jgi:S1-C subfamily serine protease